MSDRLPERMARVFGSTYFPLVAVLAMALLGFAGAYCQIHIGRKMQSAAYEDGLTAARAGLPVMANPWPVTRYHADERKAWADGWIAWHIAQNLKKEKEDHGHDD